MRTSSSSGIRSETDASAGLGLSRGAPGSTPSVAGSKRDKAIAKGQARIRARYHTFLQVQLGLLGRPGRKEGLTGRRVDGEVMKKFSPPPRLPVNLFPVNLSPGSRSGV